MYQIANAVAAKVNVTISRVTSNEMIIKVLDRIFACLAFVQKSSVFFY